MPEITRTIDIAAPPSTVWRWLATEEGLRQWMLPGIEIDLRLGGAFRALGSDGETWISGRVLEIVPEGRLVLSWLEEDSGWEHPARLVIALKPTAAGTRVKLVHDGFAGIGKPTWEATEQAYERGADSHRILGKLADVVTAALV
jgi:uncharacterized protein YndB with AHSA1/START domain